MVHWALSFDSLSFFGVLSLQFVLLWRFICWLVFVLLLLVFETADTVVQISVALWALVSAPQLGVQLCVPSLPLPVSR